MSWKSPKHSFLCNLSSSFLTNGVFKTYYDPTEVSVWDTVHSESANFILCYI